MTFTRKRPSQSQPLPAVEPAAGCSDAEFERLFEQHWKKICALLNRLTGDPAEAEDLALEVFWRLYQQPPGDNRSGLAGWL
jgi:DNA-directed RNA polymerase specialized sigma24 family protein